MKYLKIKALCLVFVGSMVISVSAWATVIIYGSGHPIDEVAAAMGDVTLAAGNPISGFSGAGLADAIGDGSSGIYGAYDALVIGESIFLSAANMDMIREFTAAGGHTVVLGRHGGEVALLNDLFGYTVTHFPASSTDHTPIHKVAEGPGPETLLALNGSWFVESAPETVLYKREGGGDAAFVDTLGSGTVSWLAWDFCECGEDDADQADWYSVLGSAAIGAPPSSGPAIPVPTLSIYGMLALIFAVIFGALYFNRRRWV